MWPFDFLKGDGVHPFDDYDPDEALRMATISYTFEWQTYEFHIAEKGGKLQVILVGHLMPGKEPGTKVCCKHAQETGTDPCSAVARDITKLKAVIRKSIHEHTRKFHHLKCIQ